MSNEWFFEKFALIADAPGAVARMRELILSLASVGKLLPEILETPVADDFYRLEQHVTLVMGQAPPGEQYNSDGKGTLFVKVGEFGPLYPRQEIWTTSPLRFAKLGDVLICVVGATVGKLNLAIDCAIGRSVAALRPAKSIDTKFLYYSLIPYTIQLRRNSKGSAQGVIGKTELNAIKLWVPSIKIQKRIVAKVDELMGLCDELEARQQERELRKSVLVRSALSRFAESPTSENLGYLFHNSYDIPPSELRKSILTLAVRGKLVPQDPEDEPAAAILRSTGLLFQHLVKNKSISSPKPLPPISENDELPFALPSGWAWCRLGQIMRISSGDGLIAKDMKEGSIPVYGGNGVTGHHDTSNVFKPTLVIGRVGFYCGSIHVTPEKAWVTDNAFITTFDEEHISMAFLSWLLKATDLRERDNATAQPVISGGKVYPTLLALPPLAEQHLIVTKVEHLMALVDELERQQESSREKATKLLDAIVHEMTSGG